jgi:hypothetical protein
MLIRSIPGGIAGIVAEVYSSKDRAGAAVFFAPNAGFALPVAGAPIIF